MTAITPTAIGTHGPYRLRSATDQADTGQVDWVEVPNWARYASIYWDITGVAGTTPVLTPSLLYGEPVTLTDEGLSLTKVVEHTAFTGMTTAQVNEVQTLTMTAGAANDTFTLTNNAVASSPITIPTGGYANLTAALIKAGLITIPAFSFGGGADITVVKSTNDYIITFGGSLGGTNIGDTTVTDKAGTADGSVANTTTGVPGAGLIVNVGPGLTGIADDVTNSATAKSTVALNTVLPGVLGVKTGLDRTTGDEEYTYTVTIQFRH